MRSWANVKAVATLGMVVMIGAGAETAAEAEPAPAPRPDDGGWKGAGTRLLKGLPSRAGAHIEQIKALGDNRWLRLPDAAGDPNFDPPRQGTVRSWSPKACYDPALGGAFITGEGGHGYVYRQYQRYSDDVVFYDLYANRWIFLYPGTHMPTLKQKMESGEYTVDRHQLGVLVDRGGRALPIAPISGHAGHQISFDPVERKLIWFGSTFTYFFRAPKEGDTSLFVKMRRERGFPDKVDGTFWICDATTERFHPVSKSHLGDPTALAEVRRVGWGRQVIQYVDSRRQHFYPASKADYWLDLAAMKMTVRPIAEGEPRPRLAANQYSACYDPKRDRVYVGGGDFNSGGKGYKDPGDNFFYYDVRADRWVKPNPKGTFPLFWDIGTAFVAYDTVGDRLVITLAQQRSSRPPERRRIYVYDPDKNEFEEPIPVPPELPVGLGHTFFCPELNAHLFNIAGDNRVGPWWVWRYRRAPEKK